MRLILNTLNCIALVTASAFAMDGKFVGQVLDTAKTIERDATTVSLALKTKKLDGADIRQKIDAMDDDLAKLKELVASFEATNPQFSGVELADWRLLKDKLQLLEIFHGQKKKLAAEDLMKNRGLIRAHADGIAKRAQKLQQTATRLQRSSVPVS